MTAPIILKRPDITAPCKVAVRDGLVEAQQGQIVFLPTTGGPFVVEDATGLAAALAAVDERVKADAARETADRIREFFPTATDEQIHAYLVAGERVS